MENDIKHTGMKITISAENPKMITKDQWFEVQQKGKELMELLDCDFCISGFLIDGNTGVELISTSIEDTFKQQGLIGSNELVDHKLGEEDLI